MTEIPTIEPMSYQKFREIYEEDEYNSMDKALRISSQFYEEEMEEDAALFGSLVVHSDIYGWNNLNRTTDRTTEFLTTEEEIARLGEEYDIWSPQDNCYFLDYNGWAVGLMPVEKDVFPGESLEEPISISEGFLHNATQTEVDRSSLKVLRPELNFGMKARRYTDSLLSDTYVKSNDLADMASIMKSHREKENGEYDRTLLADVVNAYTDGQFPEDEWIKDTQIRVDEHITLEDWKDINLEAEALYKELEKAPF